MKPWLNFLADRWPFHPRCDPMEVCAVGWPDEQSGHNILLHVHLEGMRLTFLRHPLWNWNSIAVGCRLSCRGLITSRSAPPLKSGEPLTAWICYWPFTPSHVAPAAVLRGIPAHPSGAVRTTQQATAEAVASAVGGAGGTTPRKKVWVPE